MIIFDDVYIIISTSWPHQIWVTNQFPVCQPCVQKQNILVKTFLFHFVGIRQFKFAFKTINLCCASHSEHTTSWCAQYLETITAVCSNTVAHTNIMCINVQVSARLVTRSKKKKTNKYYHSSAPHTARCAYIMYELIIQCVLRKPFFLQHSFCFYWVRKKEKNHRFIILLTGYSITLLWLGTTKQQKSHKIECKENVRFW